MYSDQLPFRQTLQDITIGYPEVSWLENGYVTEWLQVRETSLYDRASQLSITIEATKISALVTGLTGLACASSPLGIPALVLSGLGYVMSVLTDREDSRDLHPLPLSRMTGSDMIKSIFDDRFRKATARHWDSMPEHRQKKFKLFSYLPLEQKAEAIFLMNNLSVRRGSGLPTVDTVLSDYQGESRFLLYRLLVREWQHEGDFCLRPEQLEKLYQTVEQVHRSDRPLPYRSQENALPLPSSPIYNDRPGSVDRPATQQNQITPVVPPIPVAPQNDRPLQSQRRDIIEEPKPDYVIDLDRLVEEPIAPAPVAPPSSPTAQRGMPKETGIEKLMSNPFESRAFFGAQRTGKSYLVACVTQRLAEQSVKIFHINLASLMDEEDDRYWHHAQSVKADLGFTEPDKAQSIIADAINLIQAFIAAPPGAILVFDEWTILGRRTHSYSEQLEPLMVLIASTISQLVSSGIKRHKAIWTIAPDMVAGGLTDSSKLAVKDLSLVLVAVPPWKTVTWQHSSGGLPNSISFSHELYGQLQKNYAGLVPPAHGGFLSTSDRIVFTKGSWYPAGVDKTSLKTIVKQGENSYVTLSSEGTIDPLAQEFNALLNKE